MTKRTLMTAASLLLTLCACGQIPEDTTSADSLELYSAGTDAPAAAVPSGTSAPPPVTSAAADTEKYIPPTTAPPVPAPAACSVEVPFTSQNGLLPTGCELVSAKMLLDYYTGSDVPIDAVIENTVCQYPETKNGVTCAPHPSKAFVGSPTDDSSFGCYAPVIVDTMNKLLPDIYTAVDTSGTELQTLAETWLPQGRPVLVWATISMLESFPSIGWYLTDENGEPTEKYYEWLANEHCLVLVGYDSENYYFNDPLKSTAPTAYPRALTEQRFEELGKQSVVVRDGDLS